MHFSTETTGQTAEIINLFRRVFTASEGADEGDLIEQHASDPQRAIWLTDQAADLFFELLAYEELFVRTLTYFLLEIVKQNPRVAAVLQQKEAIAGETHEFKEMYPGMIETARQEGNKAAERSFDYANQVEKIHADLYQKALDNLD